MSRSDDRESLGMEYRYTEWCSPKTNEVLQINRELHMFKWNTRYLLIAIWRTLFISIFNEMVRNNIICSARANTTFLIKYLMMLLILIPQEFSLIRVKVTLLAF